MRRMTLVVIVGLLVGAGVANAMPMPGPKTYSTHQWVKGFKAAPVPSYLDRRK